MQESGVEKSSDEVVDEPGTDDPVSAAASREGLPPERVSSTEHEEILASVHRLEVELERYRADAERTSKLFLSATHYAEWVRESARRDSELALRKARVRVEKLNRTTSELEQTESELARVQDELSRLQSPNGRDASTTLCLPRSRAAGPQQRAGRGCRREPARARRSPGHASGAAGVGLAGTPTPLTEVETAALAVARKQSRTT